MAINPFAGQLVPFNYELEKLDRESDFMVLDTICTAPHTPNYQIVSPRGMGKTSLLEAFFTDERCWDLARDHKKLVYVCRFSGDEMRTEAAVLVRLIDAVEEALENLDYESSEYKMLTGMVQRYKQEYPNYCSDPNQGEALLRVILYQLKRRRYGVVLVLDEFHQLACAQSLEDSTFSKMAAIAQKKLISYIVASDYDDEVGSKSYYISPFSRIFSGEPAHLEGIRSKAGKKAVMELIRGKLSRYDDIVFTDGELQTLLELTGGVPGLLQSALRDVFEIKKEISSELSPQDLTRYALSACSPLMAKWVQYFDDDRWSTMEAVIEAVTEAAIKERIPREEDKRENLGQAGLIDKDEFRQEYRVICPLFSEYVRQELQRRGKEISVPPLLREITHGPTTINVTVEGDYYGNGAKNESKNETTTYNVQNMQVNQGFTASELIQLLTDENGALDSRGMFASRLAEQLRKSIPAGGIAQLPSRETMGQEQYAQLYDQEFDKLSQGVVQDVAVDEDNDLAVTPAELQTLDARFREARDRCRPTLSDDLLSAQSERCQFYIKLSVVVEDALELPGIQIDDYSPQLVLYGKALEQSLRDNFYGLFHREARLSVFNTHTHREDSLSPDVFANKDVHQTLIGNYTFLISEKRAYLADLCLTNQIQIPDSPADVNAWSNWWNRLQSDIFRARGIRNLADHADAVSPTRGKLDEMYDLLFGTGAAVGVLPRTVVGKRLYQQIFPSSISFEEKQRLVNSVCRVVCTTVKPNGGIKAVTCDGGYAVNVSPKRVMAYRNANGCQSADLSGKLLMVKILECTRQDNREFFAAEIDSICTGSAVGV